VKPRQRHTETLVSSSTEPSYLGKW